MSFAIAQPVILTAHESTPSDVVQTIAVRVTATEPDLLTLRYHLRADMSQLRIPEAGTVAPGRTDGLWKHTCFEAFVRAADLTEYYEFNFSTAKQWAAYHFDSYRSGMKAVDLVRAPEIQVRTAIDHLELDAVLRLPISFDSAAGGWPAIAARPAFLALSAVVEEDSGRLSYWSARHPPGKPDFHHHDAFALELQPMKSAS
jgi:hypothetical protein